MKKLFSIVLITLLFSACGSTEIKNTKDINRLKKRVTLNSKEEIQLENIIKDSLADSEVRKSAYFMLKSKDIKFTKNSLETVLTTETINEDTLKEFFIKESLKYDSFIYPESIKLNLFNYLLKNKQYGEFYKQYNGETIDIPSNEKEQLIKRIEYKKSNDRLEKLLKLSISNNDYEMFENLLKYNLYFSINYILNNKEEWFEKTLKNSSDIFKSMIYEIDSSNYEKYKNILYFYLNKNLEANFKAKVLDLIFENEMNIKEKLFSENIDLQKRAISKYGVKKSKEFFKNNLNKNKKLAFRGLAILHDDNLFDILKENYINSSKTEYLEDIFILNTPESRKFLIKELKKMNTKNTKNILSILQTYNSIQLINILYDLALEEGNLSNQKLYIDFIFNNNIKLAIKLAIKITQDNSYSIKLKQYVIKRIGEINGEETKNHILQTIENKMYKSYIEKEKKLVSFSKKQKLWKHYLEIFPKSYYKNEIEIKSNKYNGILEKIKKEITNNFNKQLLTIDKKIEEYNKYLLTENETNKINNMKNKIKKLKLEKEKLIRNNKETEIEKLENLDSEYKDLSEEINSLNQQIYYLEQEGKKAILIKQLGMDMQKLIGKKGEVLEKISLIYGYYLDNYKINGKILSEDTLSDLEER
ncbi:hypothetical protein [Haliovirga abyssi]|uniref:Uncharacterized protein n=1 Tax=Haliovirga abyssi TaxID=2996794 RepID=A0AAU9DYG8_9FUSO|nr:hypothetical protein [Haliovirga abyssi]BDU50480.1 hypothetical protein HLVA_10490 [Haliovirga abyssi]